jgi:hypothetical protein
MLKKLKNLLGTGTSKIDSLRTSSAQAVSIFNETIHSLETINETIDEESSARGLLMEFIASELNALETQKLQNEKIISKINSILED